MEVYRPNIYVMMGFVMLGLVVSEICLSRVPSNIHHTIFYLVADVKITHRHDCDLCFFTVPLAMPATVALLQYIGVVGVLSPSVLV